ncbi:hypothetical protein HGO38_17350 [Rhizobium sp. CG5]|uniref:hypothetical protein n=1 Tax=Rhizobium sp. CG5 TaxID=2726076 RepID=UPI0020349353|nr:hypothetical protein [Rhizobium sp. CG5]MCM2475248.1 hypothetical protein [Rhizobium sp. CG5]
MNNDPTERQKALLLAEDWRFHAIDYVGTGLGMLASTEKASFAKDRIVSFGLPSAPALFLNLAIASYRHRATINLDDAFIQHPPPQGTWPEEHGNLFDYFQSTMAEIVMAFSAIEAFANESIPSGYTYLFTQQDGKVVPLTGLELERRVSLDEKLSSLLPAVHSINSPKGRKPWERYRKLKALRDRLTHLKSVDRKASGPEDQTIWGSLLEARNENFALSAFTIIGAFPELVQQRRWYILAGHLLKRT